MSEMSGLYKVPSPSEINDLLRSDFGVDEAPPEKVLEVGDRANYENPVSVLSDVADTYFDTSISIELAEEIIQDLEAMGWKLSRNSKVMESRDRANYEDSISVISHLIDSHLEISISVDFAKAILEEMVDMGWHLCRVAPCLPEDFSIEENSKVLEVRDRESKVLEVGDRTGGNSKVLEVGDRESKVMEVGDRTGGNSKVLEVGDSTIKDLITQLYLDLHHIKCLSEVLCQFAASQSPEAIRTVADLINYQAETSLTTCSPLSLINHAGNTVRD